MSAVETGSLLDRAVTQFQKHFARDPQFAADAPGRVNLIGEHTDYNGGFVLPIAIDRRTVVVAAPSESQQVRIVTLADDADGQEDIAAFEATPDLKPDDPEWSNYIRGVVAGFFEQEVKVPGFDAVVCSNVPIGGGLSSSAALEVSIATMLESMCDRQLDKVIKALLCQTAEHQFAKMPCGIMDQYASACAKAGCAVLLDCQSMKSRLISMADSPVSVLVINSNVRHELTGSEYPQRRQRCEQGAAALGVKSLRDVTTDDFEENKSKLDEATAKRVRHVVYEIDRTLDAAEALAQQDWDRFGLQMVQSHSSLRDDFEVSCEELDILVELALSQEGVYGSRMTGGGFGGCTVSLVDANKADAVLRYVCENYQQKTGVPAEGFVTAPSSGARGLPL